MVVPVLAVAASSWGVLMGVAPVLQIRRMLREQSSRDVSLGYFLILLAGFVLWISYGIAAANMALVIPNAVALLVGITLVTVAVRLRHERAGKARPRAGRHGLLQFQDAANSTTGTCGPCRSRLRRGLLR